MDFDCIAFDTGIAPYALKDLVAQQHLARMREQEGTWTPTDSGSPADGDRVSVRIERLEDDAAEPRPYEFVLGRDEAIPDVEAAIKSLEVGGTGEFTVRFPEDIEAEERRGKEDRLRISLDQRKQLVLPELDDAFATGASFAPEDCPPARTVQRGGISLSQATAIAQSRVPGRVVSAKTVMAGDRVIHEIRILGDDGRVRTVRVDAQSGAVM